MSRWPPNLRMCIAVGDIGLLELSDRKECLCARDARDARDARGARDTFSFWRKRRVRRRIRCSTIPGKSHRKSHWLISG